MPTPRIVVAAYTSWIMAKDNPPSLILSGLEQRSFDRFLLVPRHVPVDGGALRPFLETELEAAPDAIIGVGLSAGSPVIRTETTAVNVMDYRVPDAAGACPRGAPIVADGPVGYRSDLPHEAIVDRLRGADIPAQITHSAGTHCCNQMLYTARHIVQEKGLNTRCGFIHVPYTHAHMARLDPGQEAQASMALDTMVDALAMILDEVAKTA